MKKIFVLALSLCFLAQIAVAAQGTENKRADREYILEAAVAAIGEKMADPADRCACLCRTDIDFMCDLLGEGYTEAGGYVWYASYGSNISYDRFMKYINRCKDTTPPVYSKAITIPYNIYFAGKSKNWGKQGVAFLDDSSRGSAYGRMYLVTDEQFADVQRMEGSGYSEKIELDSYAGLPVYTFTAPEKREDFNMPSDAYLNTIIEGLLETYPEGTEEEFREYLLSRVNK